MTQLGIYDSANNEHHPVHDSLQDQSQKGCYKDSNTLLNFYVYH